VLEACRAAREVGEEIERIVVSSSARAYGQSRAEPYHEAEAVAPTHPYAVSKATADLISRSYAVTHGLPVAVTRIVNVYGGGDLAFSRLVPGACQALVNGDRPVLRSDGTPERELLYVEDAVSAYLAVADHPGVWNVGPGEPVPVIEVVRRLIATAGLDLEPDVQGEPAARPDRQALDSSAIRTELGWEPQWDLDRGLAATYEWYRTHLTGERVGPLRDGAQAS